MVLSGVINRIDQRRIPGMTRLYADFLYDFERVAKFYPAGYAYDFDRLERLAGEVGYPEERRRVIAAMLRRQNQAWSPDGALPEATAERLEELAAPGGVAVVTGQQVGICGGPLLAFHKAMTAVLVAERLRARGVKAAPVFWMATQDHDLAEVDHLWVLDNASEPQRLRAELDGRPAAAVGGIRIQAALAPVLAYLGGLEGADAKMVKTLSACYRPEATLGGAFAELLTRWFAPWGLLVFDPLEAPEAAEIWRPYYAAVLERQPELARKLTERNAELVSAGYHAQMEQTPAATMLFFHKDGARLGLRRVAAAGSSRDYLLLGEQPITMEEARAWIEARPQQVSPSALLRPLLQNVVFPTLAHVTGPAETAYLAQTAVFYPALGAREPVVYPRASATLLDPKAQRLMQKYRVAVEEIWNEPPEELLARRALPAGVELQVGTMRATFDREFQSLADGLAHLDPTLVDSTHTAVQKIRHQLEQLEARVARSFARRSDEIQSHARHLAGSIYPRHMLQERELAAAGWLVRYPGLAEFLHDHLEPASTQHQILEF